MDRDYKNINIIFYLLFAISSQMLGPTSLLKKKEKKKQEVIWHSFADLGVFTFIFCSL